MKKVDASDGFSRGHMSGSIPAKLLLWLIFILLPSLFLQHQNEILAREDVRERREEECETMREILHRVCIMGDPEKRYGELIEQLLRSRSSLKSLAAKSAQLVRREGGALEIFLFDPTGSVLALPGGPPPPKAASQRFLKAVLAPESDYQPKLMAAFAGTPDSVTLFSGNPDSLVNLNNGFIKSFGGWWKIRNQTGELTGHLVAFVNKAHIEPLQLFDRAVGETRRLVGGQFAIGWLDPARKTLLYPPEEKWDAPLKEVLVGIPPGRNEVSTDECNIVLQNGSRGERVFCASRLPIGKKERFRHQATAGNVLAGLATLLFLFSFGLAGKPLFGLRGKLAALFLAGSGFLLCILMAGVIADRQNRELLLIRGQEQSSIVQLEKIDQNFTSELYSFFEPYDTFVRESQGKPPETLSDRCRDVRRFLARQRQVLTGVVCVDAEGRTVFFESGAKALSKQAQESKKLFVRNYAFGILKEFLTNGRAMNAGGKGSGDLVTDLLANSMFWAIKEKGKVHAQKLFNQTMIVYVDLIRDEQGKPQAILLALHNARVFQNRFLVRIQKNWQTSDRLAPKFGAIPVTTDPKWRAFPRRALRQHPFFKHLREQVVKNQVPRHKRAFFGKREFLVSGLLGRNLEGYVLFLAQPYSVIETQAFRLNLQFGVLSLVILALGCSAVLIGSTLLLNPLQDMGAGLQQLQLRNFSHRVPSAQVVEFSRIHERLNLVMENLHDMKVARHVQEHLWPGAGLSGPGWEVGGRCLPADNLGGDFHDWFSLSDGKIVLALGDVAGHGIPASLISAAAKMELSIHARGGQTPSRILSLMNTGFLEQAGKTRPMTFWVLEADLARGECTFANAGNPYAIACFENQSPRFLDLTGYPLGSRRNPVYREKTCPLGKKGHLILYSDGLVEARNAADEPFGYDRLLALAEETRTLSCQETIDAVFRQIRLWSGREAPEDDQTLVVLKLMA